MRNYEESPKGIRQVNHTEGGNGKPRCKSVWRVLQLSDVRGCKRAEGCGRRSIWGRGTPTTHLAQRSPAQPSGKDWHMDLRSRAEPQVTGSAPSSGSLVPEASRGDTPCPTHPTPPDPPSGDRSACTLHADVDRHQHLKKTNNIRDIKLNEMRK